MSGEPVTERAGGSDSAALTPWETTARLIEEARTYRLVTVRPDGSPHVAPVWAVWLRNALYLSTGLHSRKARNLAAEPRCAVSVEAGGLDITIEGRAARVDDITLLQEIADVYSPKYDWAMEVRDGGIYGGDGGGPVFAITPERVFAFDARGTFVAARYRFG